MECQSREESTGRIWYRTRCFRLLRYDFAFRSTDEGLTRYVDEAYGHCAVNTEPATLYSFVDAFGTARMHQLYIDERVALEGLGPYEPFLHFTWDVNRQALGCGRGYVMVHAAAAALGQSGILLPARMDAGKTTLVAGLLKSGFSYLSDEAAVIDPRSLKVLPFPKPLSIDEGSFGVLSALQPEVDGSVKPFVESQWQVSPLAIRKDSLSGTVSPRVIVFPRYEPGCKTTIQEVGRQEALLELLRHTFNFHELGRRNLEVLARLIRNVPCLRMTSGSLQDACTQLQALMAELEPESEVVP
jgi:hypothetical protein